jgi:hypothetical protein
MENLETTIEFPQNKDGIVEYRIKEGDKRLLLSFNRLSNFAETELTKTEDEPKEGATTDLYKEVKKILQSQAKTYGPITYRMSTGFSSMKSWIQNQGDEIFHWQKIYHPVDDTEKLVVETIISPN